LVERSRHDLEAPTSGLRGIRTSSRSRRMASTATALSCPWAGVQRHARSLPARDPLETSGRFRRPEQIAGVTTGDDSLRMTRATSHLDADVLGEPATSAPGDARPDSSRVPRPVSPREPSGMEYLTERMRSRCHHRSRAMQPCASERPRHRRRHRPSRNPDGSADRSEESRTSRPRPTSRSPPISTVRSEGSRDVDLRAVRDCRGPKRATRASPPLAPTPSGPKPFERRSSRRARSSRLPRMARDGHTVHAGHRHEGFPSRDGQLGAEAPRQPPRSGSGPRALSTPARHVDTSPAAAVPSAPARHDHANPVSPPDRPDRSRVRGPAAAPCVATDGADSCEAPRRRACYRSTPRSTRGRSHEPLALHHDCCTRATGHPSRCSSANDHICPFRSMPRTDRADVSADALGPSSSRFIACSEPYRQAIRSPPRRSEPQLGGGPTRAETRASRWKRSRKEARYDLSTSPCGVATARLHGFSGGTIAPGPAVRANPFDELQNHTRRGAGRSVTW
jgi:hypothetical protein